MDRARPNNASLFPTTEWHLVDAAGEPGQVDPSRTLTPILARYLPALKIYLRGRHHMNAEAADELLQEFVTEWMLVKRLIARATRGRGRFRSFLVISLDRFISNRFRHERAKKRSPAGKCVSLGDVGQTAERRRDRYDPYDIAWARQLLNDAIDRMKTDCLASGRGDVWGIFEGRVLLPALEGVEPRPYDQLVDKHQLVSPSQASNVLVTGIRNFNRCLRAAVAQYAIGEAQIDEELDDLRRIVFSAQD